MTRAAYRAWKCRQGVHRRGEDSCRDCHKPFGFSIRWVKQWDVQLDPSPTFVRYILPEFAGRINADDSFTPAPSVSKPQLFRVTEESIARAGIGLRFTRDYILHVD